MKRWNLQGNKAMKFTTDRVFDLFVGVIMQVSTAWLANKILKQISKDEPAVKEQAAVEVTVEKDTQKESD